MDLVQLLLLVMLGGVVIQAASVAVARASKGQFPAGAWKTLLINIVGCGIPGYIGLGYAIFVIAQDQADKRKPNYKDISAARLQLLRLVAMKASSNSSPAHDEYLRVKRILAEMRSSTDRGKAADDLAAAKLVIDKLEATVEDDRAVADARSASYRAQDN